MGEGGAIVINNERFIERAEILREKGTNRAKFFRGQVDKYTWVDIGDSFLPSEMNAAYLWGQLQKATIIFNDRMKTWDAYYQSFKKFADSRVFEIPTIPENCEHNAHMFYIKCRGLEERQRFIEYMRNNGIGCVFHYIPLHSAPAGLRFGRFNGKDVYTTKESERLVRLPLFYGLTKEQIDLVVTMTTKFFEGER